jgi:hypothetical protein
MRLYVQDRHIEEIAIFYDLPANDASIRILPSGVKQYVSRGGSSQFGDQLVSSWEAGPWRVFEGVRPPHDNADRSAERCADWPCRGRQPAGGADAVHPRSPATPQACNAQDSETWYVRSKGYKEPRNANNASRSN